MAEISKTPKKGLNLPGHFDPSVDKLRENMSLIDSLLQRANPNDLSSKDDGESNINTLTTTGRYLVKSNATGCPIPNHAGVVDVFRAGDYVLQEWKGIYTTLNIYLRVGYKTTWYDWKKNWNEQNDGNNSGLDADMLDGQHILSFYRKDYTSSDFNSAISEGKYRITSSTNAPHTNCTDWICLVYYLSGGTNELYQIAMEETYYANTSISGGTTTQYSHDVPMIYVRKKYSGTWYSWQMLWNSGNDGAGSGLDADTIDNTEGYQLVKYGETSNLITSGTPLPTSNGSASMYTFVDTDGAIGEGNNINYGIMQIYYDSSKYVRIAVSMSSGKVYRQTSGTTAWSEITPLIPVVSSDPTNPSNGQLWIRSDL